MKRSHSGGPVGLTLILSSLSIILSMLAVVFTLLPGRGEIVYVDAQKLVNGYLGMQEARKEFEKKTLVWKSNLDTLRMEAEAALEEYEHTKAKLSQKEQSLMEQLIESKHQQYFDYEQIVAEKIQQEDKELTGRVLSTVNAYMKDYGVKKGYKIIMAATQYGNIVYAEEHMDVTVDVLEGLNLAYGK